MAFTSFSIASDVDDRAYQKLQEIVNEAENGSSEAFEILHKVYDEGNGIEWDDETILNHAKKNLIHLVVSNFFKGN